MTTASGWRARAGTTFETFKQPATASRGMVVTNHPMGSAAALSGGPANVDARFNPLV